MGETVATYQATLFNIEQAVIGSNNKYQLWAGEIPDDWQLYDGFVEFPAYDKGTSLYVHSAKVFIRIYQNRKGKYMASMKQFNFIDDLLDDACFFGVINKVWKKGETEPHPIEPEEG